MRKAPTPASFSVPAGRGSSTRATRRSVMRSKSVALRRSRSRSAERWSSTRYAGMRGTRSWLRSTPARGARLTLFDHVRQGPRLLATVAPVARQGSLERVIEEFQLLQKRPIFVDINEDGT